MTSQEGEGDKRLVVVKVVVGDEVCVEGGDR